MIWAPASVGRRSGWRFAIAALAVTLAAMVGPSPASASTADIIAPSDPDNPSPKSGWQAGTCNVDTPTCDVNSPDAQFFERAAGHPPVGFTQFIVRSKKGVIGEEEPIGSLKTVHVDLPAGLAVNPQATEQCTQAEFEANPSISCPGAAVGTSFVTGSVLGVPSPAPISATVYNIEPPEGEPARFGFNLVGNNIYLQADLSWESDFHEAFTIDVPELPLGIENLILKNRLVFDGTSGDGTFITAPTTCLGEATSSSPFKEVYSTWLLASSIKEEAEPGYEFPTDAEPPLESRIPPERSPKECDSIPFDPSIDVEPNTGLTDSPAGATATVAVPEIKGGSNQSSSQVRSARVSLPVGMGLNPSAANGLAACTDAQFGKGTRNPVACPEASRVGTVEVDTPPLPDGSLTGPVFVGQQLSRDPTSGETYRIFVDVESPRYGISARLLGKVSADPQTGQLTTTFDDGPLGSVPLPGLPQVPLKSFRIKFNGGAKAPLTSPPTCGPNTTTSHMTPWSSALGIVPVGEEGGPSGDPPATPSGDFELTSLPSGGKCPKTLAERPFGPGFGTKSGSSQAGAFTEFQVDISRQDGEQELKGAAVKLPPGLTAKLAGVKYCPENAIAAAAANSGLAEAATSTCPSSSLIGRASVLAGTGPNPISIAGKVFLTGPYHGAPLSLVVVTPATAGPFDLGSVVVRVALFVHPETARVEAVADPIPHVFGGALLDVRSVSMRLDRPRFSINPTNCSAFATEGALRGGGANPIDPAAFSSFPVSAPFQVKGCEQLGFKPKLFLRLFGATQRGKNPKLRAVFQARPGDANTARVAVTLPRALFLDQSSISNVCTRVQFAANDCPRNSIYAHAQAYSPLLDEPLKGPVFLRSSNNLLPDLVFALHGQVDIDLVSRIDTARGRIRNTFDTVPDVPVSKFAATFPGGKRGLLTNSRNLCPGSNKAKGKAKKSKAAGRAGGPRAIVRMKAQNGKKLNLRRVKVRRPCR
ncbi:MAG TPA: hypothetical protein VIE64_04705 [Solirubrobacterales bacterium]